ncbi:MAG: dihydrodipicolinate synthase family protein [Eubacteriales bacterium]|nr:dihydrodipicolinate synthase family protein [Eubacteriales bacterium]
MDRIVFKGIMPALVTPVNEDGSLRKAEAEKLVKALGKTGITGYYILGGTGEGVTIDRNARMEFAELVKDAAPKGLKIINHIAATDLATVRMLAKHSREIGLDGLASVPPFFYKYDQDGIVEYYAAMSEAGEGMPLMVYASPLAGAPVPVSTIERMLALPGFVGMKYTNPNYYLMSRYKKIDGGNINIINGPDEMLALGLQMGADGGIGSTYNNMPSLYVALYDAVQRGDMIEAVRLQMKANDVIEIMINSGNVIAAVKVLLEMQGFDVGETNRPMPRFSQEEKAQLRSRFAQFDFLKAL